MVSAATDTLPPLTQSNNSAMTKTCVYSSSDSVMEIYVSFVFGLGSITITIITSVTITILLFVIVVFLVL